MKPIDIISERFNSTLRHNVHITESNTEIQCSIENVETAFQELKCLYVIIHTTQKKDLPKGIKGKLQKVQRYIKQESKYINKALTVLRKTEPSPNKTCRS